MCIPKVTFGKFKGQYADVLLNEKSYVKWCIDNNFIKQGTLLYNYIVQHNPKFNDDDKVTSKRITTPTEINNMSVLLKTMKSIDNGRKVMSEILQKHIDGKSFKDDFVLDVLSWHPTKKIKQENIEFLVMKRRPPFQHFALFYKYKNNDTVDDVSYVLCIRNLFGKYNRNEQYMQDVMHAFRNESHIGTKKTFFTNNTTIVNNKFVGICDHCCKQTSKITTDHFMIPFKTILNDFVKTNALILNEVDIFENEHNELRMQDTNLAKKWLQYHDSCAQYRMLCKQCNSRFGSYGQ